MRQALDSSKNNRGLPPRAAEGARQQAARMPRLTRHARPSASIVRDRPGESWAKMGESPRHAIDSNAYRTRGIHAWVHVLRHPTDDTTRQIVTDAMETRHALPSPMAAVAGAKARHFHIPAPLPFHKRERCVVERRIESRGGGGSLAWSSLLHPARRPCSRQQLGPAAPPH